MKAILDIAKAAAPAAISGIMGIGSGKRQLKQQGKLQKQQIEGGKEMSQFQKEQDLDMWNKTNYGAQVKHMKEAGINPALIYGMSGGGGVTTGSGGGAMPTAATAEAPSQSNRSIMDMALMAAQTKVLESQAEKTKEETKNIAGVERGNLEQDQRGKTFDNDVKEATGVNRIADTNRSELESREAMSRKERLAVETWEAVMGTDDNGKTVEINKRESRLYKTLVNEYKHAKSQLDLSEAEEIIKEWSTELIKSGMPPDSPWYYKLIERFIDNASGGKINLMNIGKGIYEKSKK